MKTEINIRYVGSPGETLCLVTEEDDIIPLTLKPGHEWAVTLECSRRFHYHYLVKGSDGTIEEECSHLLPFDANTDFLQIFDFWRNRSWIDVFCSDPFRLFLPKHDVEFLSFPGNHEILLSVYAPHISSHGRLALVDDTVDSFWNVKNAVFFNDSRKPYWECIIKQKQKRINYKLLVLDAETLEVIAWDNQVHSLALSTLRHHPVIVASLSFTGQLPKWKGAGVAVPLFSLKTRKDYGVGDLGDIPLLVDWASKTGLKVLQFLPLNDSNATGNWRDSYPYNITSAFALNPIYLCPEKVGILSDKELRTQYVRRGMHLNSLDQVDYEQALLLKLDFAKSLFLEFGNKDINSTEFKAYLKANQSWLLPYAAHCILKKKYKTPNISQWGIFSDYDEGRVGDLIDENEEEAAFVYFLQFHLWKQLKEAKAYAHRHGVALKGDIPIGVSPDGADVWQRPDLFDRAKSAGAPPDYFSSHGQVWGFPLYRWEAMKADRYGWWETRLNYFQQFFDAYRLDHILGFFRIWAVNRGVEDGGEGRYLPGSPNMTEWALNDLWHELGQRNLQAITRATTMLACGEDLGSRPDFIVKVLSQLSILTLELQRIPKSCRQLADVKDFPYLSVTATSTHDMMPLREWWASHHLSRLYSQVFLQTPDVIQGDPPPHVCEEIIAINLHSRSMLSIFPIQDWLSIDERLRHDFPSQERINDPAHAHHYWRYRLHITLEELNDAADFNQRLQRLVTASGR